MFLESILTALLLVHPARQQTPRVSASVSAATVSVGDAFTFDVTVENATGDVDIRAPHLPPGLNLVGTQDYSEMQYSIPGGRHLTRRREFALQATAPGRYRIPAVDVIIGRKVYRTAPVDVAVTGVSQPQPLESSEDAWLHAVMSPETVYVGQQSTLTVEAGLSEDVRMRLTRPPVFDTPSPTGFWVQDTPQGVTSELRPVNGQVMEIQRLQRAYFPLTAGKYALAPATATIDVREGFLFAPETREIRSASPKLLVLPVPDRGKPRDFRGAVGTYSIRASVQPDTVAAGEPVQVTIEVTGTGNIKAAPQPVLPSVPGVDQFAPTEDATVGFDGAIVRGTKVFQWVLIPQRTGSFRIPAISYSFFEPAARSYRTVSSMPMSVTVTTAAAAGAEPSATSAALRGIEPEHHNASLRWVRSRWFALLQLVPLFLIAALFAGRRFRGRKSARSLLYDELQRIRAANAPYPQFLRDLENVVRNAIALRTAEPALRTAEVRVVGERLQQRLAAPLAHRVVAFIQRVETQRFAPAAQESAERNALLKEADDLIGLLAGNGGTPGGHLAAGLLLLALLQTPSNDPFYEGTRLYRSGRFSAAAQQFELAARNQPDDVAAWANLGDAYFRAGQRGRAIWAWARAVHESPRNEAVVADLQSVGAVEVLRTRPPLSVRPVEWYLLAAILWWVACGIAWFALWRHRRDAWGWGGAALFLALIAFVTAISAQRARFAVALDDETKLYGDPTVHSPVVRSVQSGAGLDVLDVQDDWLRVRTVTGAEGWVETDAAGLL